MKKKLLFLFLLFSFLHPSLLRAQEKQNTEQKQFDLNYKIQKNKELFKYNPEEAFQLTGKLISEAKKLHNIEGELKLISQQTDYYYYHKVSFEKLIESANKLKNKAEEYKNPYFKAEANLYLFDAYCLNKLYDKALNELEEGLNTLDKVSLKTDEFYNSHAKFHIAYANYYAETGNSKQEIISLKKAIKEQDNIQNQGNKKIALFREFSNLADAYSRIGNMDSAKFYANASFKLMPQKNASIHILYTNYLVLGQVKQSENKCSEAIELYKKAEEISTQNHFLNLEKLYGKMIETFDCLGDKDSQKQYEYKLKDLKLKVFENKNESLHQIIKETKENDRSQTYIYVIAGFSIVILVLIILLIQFRKKNKLLEKQEKISQDYLLQQPFSDEQSYKDLIEMVKNNDSAFLIEFLKTFPGFTEKLQNFNPTIVQSEVEFCALLKLNLPTKDIARYKNIEPKTVQNKKYRIRKKLNIPENLDIYFWFNQI